MTDVVWIFLFKFFFIMMQKEHQNKNLISTTMRRSRFAIWFIFPLVQWRSQGMANWEMTYCWCWTLIRITFSITFRMVENGQHLFRSTSSSHWEPWTSTLSSPTLPKFSLQKIFMLMVPIVKCYCRNYYSSPLGWDKFILFFVSLVDFYFYFAWSKGLVSL